jgi:hypothetical protein
LGILPVQASDGLTGLLVRPAGNRAGIDDDDIGVGCGRTFDHPLAAQPFPDSGAIGLVASAPEGPDKEFSSAHS